jgi:hypothetical protein
MLDCVEFMYFVAQQNQKWWKCDGPPPSSGAAHALLPASVSAVNPLKTNVLQMLSVRPPYPRKGR